MSSNISGIKISPEEYFPRQKEAEEVCRKRLKRLIWQSLFFAAATLFWTILFELYTFALEGWIFVIGLLIFINGYITIERLFSIRKTIRQYKFSLERIEEYMLSGGIIIHIPQEDYEKFDIIKSKKDKYKSKSINRLKKDEKKYESEKQKELKQKEYERKVEEEFRKQYYPDEEDNND